MPPALAVEQLLEDVCCRISVGGHKRSDDLGS